MVYKLDVSNQAQGDLLDAVDYYDNIDPELGHRFYREIDAVYAKLREHPQYYSFVDSKHSSNVRDVKILTFPYVLIFEIQDNAVLVIAIKHTLNYQ